MISNKYFFIADTHFGHNNVISYENRPFENVEEMNAALINNWNKVVKNGHEVFVLGDFSFCWKERTEEIISRLNGYKTLIIGNHDTKSVHYYRSVGFDEVSKYPVIFQENWILSHQPISLDIGSPFKNIYGHIHGRREYPDYNAQSFCVSVERIGYRPIEFRKIMKKMAGYSNEKERIGENQWSENDENLGNETVENIAKEIINKHKNAFEE